MWDALFSKLDIQGAITYPLLGARELDKYEHEIKRSLPKSYREFCLKFGPGKIIPPVKYDISAPGPTAWESYSESRYLNRIADDSASGIVDEYTAEESDVKRLSNALYFGSDISLQFYFWDKTEVTSPEHSEYAIYVIQRLGNIVRLADTFFDFITNTCLVSGIPGDNPAVERHGIFMPAVIPVASPGDGSSESAKIET